MSKKMRQVVFVVYYCEVIDGKEYIFSSKVTRRKSLKAVYSDFRYGSFHPCEDNPNMLVSQHVQYYLKIIPYTPEMALSDITSANVPAINKEADCG